MTGWGWYFLAEASASLTEGEIITLGETGSASMTSLRCQNWEHCVSSLWIFFLEEFSHISCERQPACSAAVPPATARREAGDASLLRLPQFLFNCLLIYLIMAATRTCGQAASLLSPEQFAALKWLMLDNPPSPLDLHQEQQDVTAGWSHLAPRQQRQKARDTKGLQGDWAQRGISVDWILRSKEMPPGHVPASRIRTNLQHLPSPHWFKFCP